MISHVSFADIDVSAYVIGRNCCDTLAEALDSIYAQTARVDQVVYLDDGSTDASLSIAERYVGRGLQILKNDISLGIPLSRNRAVRACTRRWVAVLDADDRWHPEKIERQMAYLAAHSRVGLVGSYARVICRNAGYCGVITAPISSEEIKDEELTRNCFVHSSVMFRRDIFEQVGGYANLPAAQDYDLMLKFSERTDLANLPEALVDYRIGGGAVSVRSRKIQMVCTARARDEAYRRRDIDRTMSDSSVAFMHGLFLSCTLFNPSIHWGVHQLLLGDPVHGRRLLRNACKEDLRSGVAARLFMMIPNAAYRTMARIWKSR